MEFVRYTLAAMGCGFVVSVIFSPLIVPWLARRVGPRDRRFDLRGHKAG